MPGPVGSSSSAAAAAAAAAAARRAAEEARRRAQEEAQKRAQEAARKKAQEQAQKAQQQKAQAAKAQQAAKEKAQKAQEAQKKAQEAQVHAQHAQQAAQNQAHQLRDPDLSAKDRTKIQADIKTSQKKAADASAHAADLQKKADAAKAESDAAHTNALKQADEAIKSQQAANESAKAAGQKEPFKIANTVKDAVDAGSLSAKQQEKLLGAKVDVDPKTAATADAQRVREAAEKGPGAGAAELKKQLEQNDDPNYRDALLNAAHDNGTVDKITHGLAGVSQTEANQAVKDLGHAADLTSPEASRDIADSLRAAEGSNPAAEAKINGALKDGSKDPAVARVAVGLADGLREAGKYDAADKITKLDPTLKKTAAQSTGETKARDAVRVNTVVDERRQIEQSQKDLTANTKAKANELFEARDKNKLPPNTSVVGDKNDPNRVELVTKNKKGEITERTIATRGPDGTSLDSTSYDKKGNASRDFISTSADGKTSTVQHADWKTRPTDDRSNPPSIESLKNSRDKSVNITESKISHTDNNNLVQEKYQQNAKIGVQSSTSTYDHHDNEDGLDDNFKDKFDDGKVDHVETRSYSIPPPGAKGPDGKKAEPTYTRTQEFSQDGVKATAQMSKPLTGDDFEVTGRGQPNGADMSELQGDLRAKDGEDGEEFDGNSDNPKQWTLETSNGNKYASQTFVEGHTDASIITHREAEGNTVNESVTGKTFSTEKGKEGEMVDIHSNSSTTYNDKGQVTSQKQSSLGPDGVNRISEYSRTESKTKDGKTQINESTTSTITPPDGSPISSKSEQTSVVGKDGQPQLTRAYQYVRGPGGESTAELTPKGQTFTVNGQELTSAKQLNGLPKDQQFLAANARDGLNSQVNNFGRQPGEPGNLEGGEPEAEKEEVGAGEKTESVRKGIEAGKGALALVGTALTKQVAAKDLGFAVKFGSPDALTAAKYSAAKLGVAANGIGVVANGVDLLNNIQNGNYVEAAKAGAGLVGSGAGLVGDGAEAISAIKGAGAPLAEVGGKLGTVGDIAGKFSVGAGVVAGGISIVDGIVKGDGVEIAQGAVTAGAAIGGYLAAGAVAGSLGGPAGAAVGVAIGLAAYGATKLIGSLFGGDSEHAIADVKI